MKKVLALILVLLLTASLFCACTGDTEESGSNQQGGSSLIETGAAGGADDGINSVKGFTPSADAYTPYDELVTFTTARNTVSGASFPEGMSITENPIVDAVYEKLNVEMEVLWQTSDYNTKLDMCIVSEDLPDIFWVDNYMTFRELLDGDMIEPLTEAYANCAGAYMKSVYATYGEDIFTPFTSDGELYALPSTNNGYQYPVLWVRQDWLDALGLDMPTTRDEIVAVAKAFMEKDPGGNGAGKTVGIAVQSSPIGGNSSFSLDPIFNSFGSYPGQWITDDNGSVIYGSITEATKEALSYVADLYAEGVLDPQFITRDYSDVVGLMATGKCGICFAPWSLPYSASDFAINCPDGEWAVAEAPVNDNGEFTYISNRLENGIMCVRKGFEYPELLIKMLNVEFDMFRGIDTEGYEALTPVFDAGTTWTALMMTGAFNLEYDDAVLTVGSLVKNFIEKGVTPEGTTQYNAQLVEKAKAYWDDPDASNSEGWILYTSRYIASNSIGNGVKIPSAYNYSTDTMSMRWSTLEKQEDEYFLKVVTGEADISEFDSFVEQWKSLGGDTITAEVQEIVDGN